ncbi:hypothetical protein ACFC96_36595 [Streptomyces sp. NPDC055955]
MRAVSAGFACEPVEFNAEGNHAHLLLNFPPQVLETAAPSGYRHLQLR